MMETFIVLGLCFILYEALDFFQGCMHSNTPNTTDQIDAYRRQLEEQRQLQQQEQFLANFSPLLGVQFSSSSNTTTPTASTASVISDLRDQQLQQQQQQDHDSHSVSTPALNGGGFRPAHRSVYESQELHATSSLPRDYYYLQQQQLKNKHSSKSLLSKFSSGSDNRIFPESPSVLGVPASVITTQPGLVGNTFDCQPPIVAPSPLAVDLKRAILSNNNNNNNNINNHHIKEEEEEQQEQRRTCLTQNNLKSSQHNSNLSLSSGESDSEESSIDSSGSDTASAGSASLASCSHNTSEHGIEVEREFAASSSCTSSHADFREIECERLRRKCVSVKRIYSISENF